MQVMTVRGAIPAGEVGTTLVHEHLVMNTTRVLDAIHGYVASDQVRGVPVPAEARWNPGAFRDNYDLSDPELAIEELNLLRGRIDTIVDCTSSDIGRDPVALRTISESTGVQVVMGGGWYLAGVRDPALRSASVSDLARVLVGEFETGVGGSGVRPGVIGELGTSDPLQPPEESALRAAAIACNETGLAVTVHVHPWGKEGTRVLEILADADMPMGKVILNHISTAYDDIEYQDQLLASGCYLAFDLFGFDHSLLTTGRYAPSDYDVAVNIARLVSAGFVNRVLISHDIGVRTRLKAYDGWGYSHISDHVVPMLQALGLTDQDLRMLLVTNPMDVLSF